MDEPQTLTVTRPAGKCDSHCASAAPCHEYCCTLKAHPPGGWSVNPSHVLGHNIVRLEWSVLFLVFSCLLNSTNLTKLCWSQSHAGRLNSNPTTGDWTMDQHVDNHNVSTSPTCTCLSFNSYNPRPLMICHPCHCVTCSHTFYIWPKHTIEIWLPWWPLPLWIFPLWK